MPSPFPGMDPYLEEQAWSDFHNRLITEVAYALAPVLRPRYVARIEERVYLERGLDEQPETIRPDVTVIRTAAAAVGVLERAEAVAAPVTIPLPMPERVRQTYLEVRLRATQEVVTVLEILSPGNKRQSSAERREYLSKREAVLQSDVHLVELDLLRGGARLPTLRPLPVADHYVAVSRAPERPNAQVWPILLRQRLPVIPVPLAGEDPEAALDLQAVFNGVYDRGRL